MSKHFYEIVEYEFSIAWAAACLRVELRREVGQCAVAYAFVGAIVHVHEQWFPVGRQCLVIHSEAMVLRCYEAAFCSEHSHRLVVAPVAVFEFICGCAGCFCHQLVAHADAADWLLQIQDEQAISDLQALGIEVFIPTDEEMSAITSKAIEDLWGTWGVETYGQDVISQLSKEVEQFI